MIASRYSLKDEVGRGGMGVVWRAEDELLGRDVAVKRVGMSPGGASVDIARAAREARLAATLNHPNVVAVFDLVEQDDAQWLVMEYVESRTLAHVVAERSSLPPDEAAQVLCQAADALAAAHRAGIVHRDVKPSNILVTPDGKVKITDFGIARAHADTTLTQTGMMTGSPAYLAPEVASGGTATPASDVWSFGATLFHALAGRPPYDVGNNVMGALYRIVNEDPPPLPRAGWLAPLLAATMTKDPEARWSMERVASFLRSRGGWERGDRPTEPAAAETTAMLAPVPAAAPTVTPPTAATPTQPRKPGAGRWWLLAAAAAALALLVAGWIWLDPGSGERPNQPAGTASSDEPSASETQDGGSSAADEQAMETFVSDYLATVTSDPETAWQQLTPEFQAASGGYETYSGFWSTIESATPQTVSADPAARTVTYSVSYVKTDGSEASDTVTLQLTRANDSYLIAGES